MTFIFSYPQNPPSKYNYQHKNPLLVPLHFLTQKRTTEVMMMLFAGYLTYCELSERKRGEIANEEMPKELFFFAFPLCKPRQKQSKMMFLLGCPEAHNPARCVAVGEKWWKKGCARAAKNRAPILYEQREGYLLHLTRYVV